MEVEWHLHDMMGEATTAREQVRMIGLEREGGLLPQTGIELSVHVLHKKTLMFKALLYVTLLV